MVDHADRKRILVIDDSIDICTILKIKLETSGYQANVAYTGISGLESVKSYKPDLVILDVMLPDINGYEVLERIKADDDSRGIPVVMLTVKGVENRRKALDGGASDYFVKPFVFQELLDSIKTMCSPIDEKESL